ncbi:cytosolic sulfotransferase 2-like isoform X1 [Oreochromis aureus]|uniref:Sulfotransferase n=2 Tax=Oreochromis aureus TaxID=47969 RepID=A0A668RLF3_OREAU|nr:cytosolic sulfotransferase 2-like isoform X1 [Oreochromis aureus]
MMESLSRPTLFDFHGVCMTNYFTDNWENVQNFRARPDDIVLASYPKAGNTWVSYILDLLYFGQTSPERQSSVPLHERVPFLEIQMSGYPSGVDVLNELTTYPRIIKTHLPVQFLPKSFWEQNSKIIYVARNAKDSAVSYFHFDRMNKVQPEPGSWESFLQRFMEGKMVFGSWYEHVRGWWEKKQSCSNILYLFYEDLIEDTEQELVRICSFLGLSPTTELKKQVTEKVQFDNMKNNKMVNGSADEVFDLKISPFMRKGRVGDWKNHFTVQQDEQFNEDYKKKMKNTDLQFRTVL